MLRLVNSLPFIYHKKCVTDVIISPPCRDEFNLKLALLSNQWQGVVRRAQQRRGIIDGLIRQWQRYREMVEKLRKWLVEVSHPAEVLQAGATVPLQQARSMLDAVQVHNGKAYRAHFLYLFIVDATGQNHLILNPSTNLSRTGIYAQY